MNNSSNVKTNKNLFVTYFVNLKNNFKVKHYIFAILFGLFTIIAGILSTTGAINRSTLIIFEQIGYTIIAVISLSLVVGFLGELSLGHAGFMSIGAYFGVIVQQTIFSGLTKAAPLLSLIIAALIGGLVAAIVGAVIGLPTLRLKGDYLAIVTLAFGEIVNVIFQNTPSDSVFGGTLGIRNSNRYDIKALFIIIFVFVILTIALVKNFLKSKHGRAVMAIRDNEIAARAMGINVTYYKMFVFVLSAFLAGVAGVFYGASQYSISSTVFNYNYSINNLLVVVVIGGMGNLTGSIIAAIAVTYINLKLMVLFTGNLAPLRQIIFAIILVGIVIYNNAPGLKNFREKYNFKKLWNWILGKIMTIPFMKRFAKSKTAKEAIEKDFSAEWSNIPTKIKMDALLSTDVTVDGDVNMPDKHEKNKKGE